MLEDILWLSNNGEKGLILSILITSPIGVGLGGKINSGQVLGKLPIVLNSLQ